MSGLMVLLAATVIEISRGKKDTDKQTDRQTNGHVNPTPATAVDVGNKKYDFLVSAEYV